MKKLLLFGAIYLTLSSCSDSQPPTRIPGRTTQLYYDNSGSQAGPDTAQWRTFLTPFLEQHLKNPDDRVRLYLVNGNTAENQALAQAQLPSEEPEPEDQRLVDQHRQMMEDERFDLRTRAVDHFVKTLSKIEARAQDTDLWGVVPMAHSEQPKQVCIITDLCQDVRGGINLSRGFTDTPAAVQAAVQHAEQLRKKYGLPAQPLKGMEIHFFIPVNPDPYLTRTQGQQLRPYWERFCTELGARSVNFQPLTH